MASEYAVILFAEFPSILLSADVSFPFAAGGHSAFRAYVKVPSLAWVIPPSACIFVSG